MVIKLNYPFLFTLGPIQIAPLVRGLVLLRGVSSSCLWKYFPKGIAICLLLFRVSPVIISMGLMVVKIPDVVGKNPKSLKLFNNILIFKIIGNLMKGRLCLVVLYLYLTTQSIRSISGVCLLELVNLTISPLDISAISSRTRANSLSA